MYQIPPDDGHITLLLSNGFVALDVCTP